MAIVTKFKYLLSVLALSLGLLGPCVSQRLFIFGDSLFDPGNSFYLNGDTPTIHFPYGMTLNHPTGRYSDGLLVSDYIALFANMSIMPPYLKPGANFSEGANFACAGAGALEIREGTVNLKEQLAYFMKVAASYVQQYNQTTTTLQMNRSVFLFSVGGADYFELLSETPNPTDSQKADYVNWVIGNLTSALTDVYNVGGRRIAFQNVAALGCEPGSKQWQQIGHGACYQPLNQVATLHNSALLKTLQTMKNQLIGFRYVVFDYYNTLEDRIQNPTKYGFREGDVACCGSGSNRGGGCGSSNPYELCSDPNQYVYFDGYHTGQNANIELALLMWNGGTNVTSPYNVKRLFGLV